jgi:hypothetical protein
MGWSETKESAETPSNSKRSVKTSSKAFFHLKMLSSNAFGILSETMIHFAIGTEPSMLFTLTLLLRIFFNDSGSLLLLISLISNTGTMVCPKTMGIKFAGLPSLLASKIIVPTIPKKE